MFSMKGDFLGTAEWKTLMIKTFLFDEQTWNTEVEILIDVFSIDSDTVSL